MSISNSTNDTGNSTHEYASLRDQLAGFGFYYLTDILVTAIYIPTCFIGSFLSLICVVVFYQRDFKLPMYAYLRLYSIANTLLALVSIYSALTTPIQLFPFFNSQASNIYVSYVYEPIMSMCYFFTTVLDIAMLMDRIAIFVPKLKPVFCKHPYIVSAVIFVICLCIDFPFFFFYMPNSTLFQLNDTEYYRLYYVDYTSFGYSDAGRVVQYCQWALRDILPVVLIFICGVVSVALLKAHMRKKQRIIGPARKTAKSDGDTHSKNESASHTGHAAGHPNNDPDAHSINNSINGHQSHHHRHQSSEKHAGSRSNMRFSLLVYSISFLTTIQSIFSILALASILLDPGSILVTITNNVFNCFLVFKICCYFFIFYFLNSNFKKKINSWVMLKSSTSSTK